jgi:hypothetical protein
MNTNAEIAQGLREHLALCQELLAMVMRENTAWRDPNAPSPLALYQSKKQILPRLQQSLEQIRACRQTWQKRTPAERKQAPEIAQLLEQNQNLILKIVMLDRENEQTLLRRGFGPPKEREPAIRQQPHFVAGLYRRNTFC